MISPPLISLVIPTRERADTLQYAIASALDQTSDAFEVIVSDNFSADSTRSVVEAFDDPRLKYANPGRRLSMSDNWEFAYLQTVGDFVIFIGDDDAVMPGGLDRLAQVMKESSYRAYNWPKHIYVWPIEDQPARVEYMAGQTQPRKKDLRKTAHWVVRHGGWRHYLLPSGYHSAVSRRAYEAIRERTGRLFHSTQPDVFMSVAVPAIVAEALDIGFTVTVFGRSGKSNGGGFLTRDSTAALKRFIAEYGDYRIHPTLFPGIGIGPNLTADSVLAAMEAFPSFYSREEFDYDAMWAFLSRESNILGWDVRRKELLARRNEIRKYHPFRVGRFLLHCAVQEAAAMRARLRSLLQRSQSAQTVPSDIRKFVVDLKQ